MLRYSCPASMRFDLAPRLPRMQAHAPTYEAHDVWTSHRPLPNRALLAQAQGDAYPYVPQRYLPHYRNPCWQVWSFELHKGMRSPWGPTGSGLLAAT